MKRILAIIDPRSINEARGTPIVVESEMDAENPKNPGPIIQRIEQIILDSGVEKNQVRKTICEITGVSSPALVKWFNGDTVAPSVEHIVAIQKFFKVDLTWLITGEGDHPESLTINNATSKKIEEALDEASKKNTGLRIDLPRLQSVNISCDSIFPKNS